MTTLIVVGDAITAGVEVVNGVGVIAEVVSEEEMLTTGMEVPATNEEPGVRKRLTQTGSVRMEGSMGSINPPGLPVRKALFGSRFEAILVFNFQLGEKRRAHCPATITHRNPIPKIRGMINQSPRSCSGAFMHQSIELVIS